MRLIKKLRFLLRTQNRQNRDETEDVKQSVELCGELSGDLEIIRTMLGNSSDLTIRKFSFGKQELGQVALVFIDGLADSRIINESIIKPLIYDTHLCQDINLQKKDLSSIQDYLLAVANVAMESGIEQLMSSLLQGKTIFLLDGHPDFLGLEVRGWEKRAVEEPKTEQAVRGPREGFTETLRTNTAMLRRKIRNSNLVFEEMVIGKRTCTRVAVAYISSVAPIALVKEVKRRLGLIQVDDILESGYIEQLIEDAPLSPFSTVGNSEKPDRVAARILEGRVAIIVDGTPFVLTVPFLFVEGFQASEDYYSRPFFASFVRLIRYLAFAITLLAPATFVALESFHPELMPTPLVITVAAAVAGTPFPSVIEALLMSIVFELLREGGIRLPTNIGPALSIVGALITGDAAVKAGLISAPMVIVIAITAVSSFLVISHTDAVTLLRFALIIAAGFLGIYGIGIVLITITVHLCSIRSFGLDYLAPLAPLSLSRLGDYFVRAPLKTLLNRGPLLKTVDPEREHFRLELSEPTKD